MLSLLLSLSQNPTPASPEGMLEVLQARRALSEFLVEVPVRQQLGFNNQLYILDGLLGPEGLSIDLLDKHLVLRGSLDVDDQGNMDVSGIFLSSSLRMAEEGEWTDLCVPIHDRLSNCSGSAGTLVIYRGVSGDPVALDLRILAPPPKMPG